MALSRASRAASKGNGPPPTDGTSSMVHAFFANWTSAGNFFVAQRTVSAPLRALHPRLTTANRRQTSRTTSTATVFGIASSDFRSRA